MFLMKKLNIICNSLCFCLCIGVYAFAENESKMDTIKVDRSIVIDDKGVNGKLEYPLISCNDLTYMSVRDVGTLLNRKVTWIEETSDIFMNPLPEEDIIKEWDTVYAIGKAIALEHFPDLINENTRYAAAGEEANHIGSEMYYTVYILFDAPELENEDEYIVENADVQIEIMAKTGSINIIRN